MRFLSFLIMFCLVILTTQAHAEPLYSGWQQSLADAGPWLTPLLMIIMPLFGFGTLIVLMTIGMHRLTNLQQLQNDRSKQDEQALQKRERVVLAAALSGELTENKIKCEAFITIYSELLRNLRETDRPALYEETGDFIHQHPPLSRKVFDGNVDKIPLLGVKLAGDVTNAYASIRTDADYFTLEASTPRANAIRMVEMVLDDAQRTLEPLDNPISGLNMIVRDGPVKQGGK
jgi:hypothetical protein